MAGCCCQRLAAAVAVTVAVSRWSWSPSPRSPRRRDPALSSPGPSPEPDSCREHSYGGFGGGHPHFHPHATPAGNPRIKRRARQGSRPSESVCASGSPAVTWTGRCEPVRNDAAALLLGPAGRTSLKGCAYHGLVQAIPRSVGTAVTVARKWKFTLSNSPLLVMRQAICYMPAHSHQRTNHRRDTYSRICLGRRSVNVTQRAYSCLAPCNKPGRCRADLLVSLLRISFLYLDSGSIWPTCRVVLVAGVVDRKASGLTLSTVLLAR